MKLARLDLNLLTVLETSLHARSVTLAARRVGLSKPAMSHALARLRAQMGDPILVRAGQRWVLSERAERLLPRLQLALDEARGVLSAERAFEPGQLRREFRIHASDCLLSLFGVEVGEALGSEAPGVVLTFVPPDADKATTLRQDVDLALGVFGRCRRRCASSGSSTTSTSASCGGSTPRSEAG